MAVYTTDNEPHATLRGFFVANGKLLVIGAVIGMAALLAWRCWHVRYNGIMMVASSAWQWVNTGLTSPVVRLFPNVNDNNGGALTSLGLVQQCVKRGDFADAEKYLQKALGQTCEVNLQSLIKLRLARVQLQQKNVDGAFKTLDGVREKGWIALAEDTRGDAQVIKGDYQAARSAYEKALQFGMSQPLVRMKLNNLSSQEGSHGIY